MEARQEMPSPGPALSEEYMNEYSGGTLVAIAISFMVLTTITVALRFYSKRFKGAYIGIDDGFIAAAYVVNLGLDAVGISLVVWGGSGQHVDVVRVRDPAALIVWAKLVLIFQMVYFACVALPKAAIILLYLRVFAWRGPMRTTAHAMLGLIGVITVGLIVTSSAQCRPLAYWWDPSIPGGYCFNLQLFFHIQALPGILLDFAIMALPLRTVWALKMPRRARLALIGIFLVASFGVVASIVRAATFFSTAAFTDRTWSSVHLIGWSLIETGTYVIAACLPHLRPLFSQWTPTWLKATVRRVANSDSNNSGSRNGKPLAAAAAGTAVAPAKPWEPLEDDDEDDDANAPTWPIQSNSTSSRKGREKGYHATSAAGAHLGQGGIGGGMPGGEAGGQIQVTTEILMERHDATKAMRFV